MRQLMDKNMNSGGQPGGGGTGMKFHGAGTASAYKNPTASKPVGTFFFLRQNVENRARILIFRYNFV